MKKLNYITAFIIVGVILFQPTKQTVTNYIAELNRLEVEKSINKLIEDNKVNYKEMKSSTRKGERPDLRGIHNYLMTHDPNIGRIPTERLLDAIAMSEQKRNSASYNKRLSEVNWEERGPNNVGGRTRALLVDPNDADKLWAAGVTGGLWYNTDITSSNEDWNLVDGTWASLSVCSIDYDPNDTSIMYVGTGERMGNHTGFLNPGTSKGLGMWKSTDAGTTWTHLSSTVDFSFVSDIIVRNESGVSVIYIAVGGQYYEGQWIGSDTAGLWKSSDGGSTWTRAFDGVTANGSSEEIGDLAIGSDNRLWAGSRLNNYNEGGGQIYFSDDGSTWTNANWQGETLGVDGNRVIIQVAPSDPNTVYALVEDDSDAVVGWIPKTTDGGATWTNVTVPLDDNGYVLGDANGQAGYDLSLGIDPNNANIVYAGELDVFKTSDGGSSWTQMTNSGGTTYANMHVDQHNIKNIDSNKVIFSNDGGVYYSSNGGVQVENRNDGYNVSQFYTVAIHPSTKYVIGGTQDNGSWTIGGTTLSDGNNPTGGDGAFAHIDQLDPNYQFTSSQYNNIYRSTNGGTSFSAYINYESGGADTGLFINPSIIDPNTQTFYSSVDSNTILRSTNYSQLANISTMNIALGSTASAYKFSPYTNDLLFVGTSSGRVFKIANASTTNFAVTEITGSNVQGYISSIDIGKDDNQILLSVANYGVESLFETIGGGGSNGWIAIEGDLPDMPIRWALYNDENYNQVIVATEVGTWISDDVSTEVPVWNPSNDGISHIRVDMLSKRSDGAMAAGTHGRGIFYSEGFTSTAPLNAAFGVDKTSGVFPVSIQFTDRSTGLPDTWSWDFGDGNTSTVQSPVHTYTTAGQFNVSLTVGLNSGSSDNVTKNNVVWATAQQDTLWVDGFESSGESYPRNGRNNYSWTWRDVNGDGDGPGYYPESINAGFELAYDEDKGLGFGNAAADATDWDDWYISPELWLRPGVDNLTKFYANGFNSAYPETFDVMLSPSGGSEIEDFTVTLANVIDNGEAWTEYIYDLTPWAGNKVRIAIHHKSSAAYYEFYDLFMVTAGQLSADGAPNAPDGVTVEPALIYEDTDADGTVSSGDTWTASDNSLGIFWNRNAEPDLASYNVYASQTDGFTPGSSNLLGQGIQGEININIPVLDANDNTDQTILNPDYYNMRTFGADSFVHENLIQGDTWYYKVGAVDNDGNETISEQIGYVLDSIAPTTGTFTIDSIIDGSYLRSTSEVAVTAADWSDNTGINYYVLGIGSSGDNTSADIVAYQNVGTSTLELTGLSLDDYTTYHVKLYAVDGAGNLSSLVINDFMTYNNLLGDYDADWDVDVEDLNAFVNAWPNAGVDTTVDIGPATGTSPYLSPSFDNLNDINDVSVFTRNWLWTKAQGKTSEPVNQRKLNPIEFPAQLFGNQIKITLPDNITAGRFEIINEGNTYQFSVAKNNQSMIILENNNSLEESYEFEFGRLSQDEKELFIYVDGDVSMTTVEVSYQLFSKDGAAGNGIMKLGSPDEFKLYQNYPNPFSSQTTFQYDVAEATSVKIYIYNTLGQLVKTIDRGDNGVGTHTVEWDGKNDDGDTLSSGVYFYQLRTKDFNKTMKMLLVK